MKRSAAILIMPAMAMAVLGGCSGKQGATYTLYRNSPFGEARVHWGTFDAEESDAAYNLNNCMMAARLLNANLEASAKVENKEPSPGVGFWCEPGGFEEKGPIPSSFPAAFPTDV
jgi:hypothetical protein